jgi:signal transduction histidine kinase
MKSNSQVLYVILATVFFTVGSVDCAGLDSIQNHEISIQEIMERWAAIERAFIEEQVLAEKTHGGNLNFEEIDALGDALNAFLNSETYRIFRLAPLSSDANSILGPSAPNEIPEIHVAASLLLDFREEVFKGETEKAILTSANISSNLVRALARSGEVEQFAHNAYLRLLLVFTVFITLTAFVFLFLYKALTSSLKREAYGAWFSQAVLLAQEEERSRLSRELHDTVAQDLRCLSLGMDKIGNCPETAERRKLCAETAEAHSLLIRKVRDICDFLVPPDFRFQGIDSALRRLCMDYGKRTGIDCRIDIAENLKLKDLSEEKQLQIFRIVQEALTNVEKHARAAEAIVIMRCGSGKNISIGISDDGKGFLPPDAKNLQQPDGTAHLGIRGMNERAALLGGSLLIKSEPGEGTLVCLEIPISGGQ